MQTEMDGRRCVGKVALVTGASRGIGAAIARRLASEGATLACAARTLESAPKVQGSLQETVNTITDDGGRARAFPADISKSEERQRLATEVLDAFGKVDILVNDAAATFFIPTDRLPEKRFRLMVETQVWGPLELSQLVIPSMRAEGRGWILNISSRAAVKPIGPPWDPYHSELGSTGYGMCKAALERLSGGLAAELYKDGIAVNALSPWKMVPTPGAGSAPEHGEYPTEPVECMAEAAMQLCTVEDLGITGRCVYSLPFLAELDVRPRSLTGGPFAYSALAP